MRTSQAAKGQVVIAGIDVDPDVAAAKLEGGYAGGAGSAERVQHHASRRAPGGDAAQWDVDGESSEMRGAERTRWHLPQVTGVVAAPTGSVVPTAGRQCRRSCVIATACR